MWKCFAVFPLLIIINNNRVQWRNSRFSQSPHCAANRRQHVRSNGPCAIACKSRAKHRALFTCNMSCYVPRGTKGRLLRRRQWKEAPRCCWLVGCLPSQQHASASQGRVCSDNCTCCHTDKKLQIKLTVSPGQTMLTPGRLIPVLTL